MATELSPRPPTIARDASIILLGMPGTGKSSLAIMLSVAFDWPIRESSNYLKSRFGQPLEIHKKEIGTEAYQAKVRSAVSAMLEENSTNCVITCDVAIAQSTSILLREYANTHLVIYVQRDIEGIMDTLKSWDRSKVEHLLRLTTPLFRSCANLEYYNLTEKAEESSAQPISHILATLKSNGVSHAPGLLPSLSLKSVERDFIKFACAARNVENGMTWDISSPISETLTEKRTYTYAVSVTLRDTLASDIERASVAADAFEITIGSDVDLKPESLTEISHAVSRVRRRTTLPIILHVKKQQNDQQGNTAYLQLVTHCLRLIPDFISIDLSYSKAVVSRLMSAKSQTTRVIGHLNLSKHKIESWHDRACLEIYNLAKSFGVDVVRLCLAPKSMADNFAIQSYRNYVDLLPPPNPPLIAYNTGLLGRTSLCLNSAMTPVRAPHAAGDFYDGEASCVTAKESTASLFGLFVHVPLSFWFVAMDTNHTLSPDLHNAAFEAFGIPHTFAARQIESIHDCQALVNSPSFGGLSVGPPFKADAVELVQSLSAHARAIGAVNTIIPARRKVLSDTTFEKPTDKHIGAFDGSDTLHGDNTDWIGMAICILRGSSPVNAVRPKTSALVVGAGSMARAAIYALLCLGVQNIAVYNRTEEHAKSLVKHYQDLDSRTVDGRTIKPEILRKLRLRVVTALEDPLPDAFTPPTIVLGCIPAVEDFVLPERWLTSPTGGVFIDMGYEALTTSLVDQFWSLAPKSWIVMRGLDFLPEQGCPQFELFTGRRAPRRLMRTEALDGYRRRHLAQPT